MPDQDNNNPPIGTPNTPPDLDQAEIDARRAILEENKPAGVESSKEFVQWMEVAMRQFDRRSSQLGKTNFAMEMLLESLQPLRFVGYGLLVLVLIDLVSFVAVNPQPLNPVWEWQFMGMIIDRSGIILLGLGLAFLGKGEKRSRAERHMLQPFYWGTFLIGLAFLLMLPLGVNNGLRLKQNIDLGYLERTAQVNDVEKQTVAGVEAATSLRDLQRLFPNSRQLPYANPADFENLKAQSIIEVRGTSRAARQQLDAQVDIQRKDLYRRAAAMLAASLVSAILFLVMWRRSKWIPECRPSKHDEGARPLTKRAWFLRLKSALKPKKKTVTVQKRKRTNPLKRWWYRQKEKRKIVKPVKRKHSKPRK